MATFTTTCRRCGADTEAERTTRRFCSDACRHADLRDRRAREIESLRRELASLGAKPGSRSPDR